MAGVRDESCMSAWELLQGQYCASAALIDVELALPKQHLASMAKE